MSDDENEGIARRKLLKLGVYAAPIIIGTLSVKTASAQPGMCNPNNPGGMMASCPPVCTPMAMP